MRAIRRKEHDPVWAPIFEGYEPVRRWLAERKPDVLFLIYNDHITSFFLDHYSHFALGIGSRFWPADEGGRPRKLPPVDGHPRLAQHIANGLTADEFDLSFFQGKGLDHGCFSPLSVLWPRDARAVGVLVPFPRERVKLGRRCARRSRATPRPQGRDRRHRRPLAQVHGERSGFNNTPWDMEFLELLEKDPQALTRLTIAEYAERGGLEGAEVVMWLIMRGALSNRVRKTHQSYYLPSMTAIASVIFENEPDEGTGEPVADYRARIAREWAGIEKLQGTYPFTIERSVKAYRLNAFLHRLIEPKFRRQFLDDAEPLFQEAELSDEERGMIRRRDWRALIRYGAIFFLLEKLGAAVGTTNLHIYAAMRGQSLEEFQKTRNAQVLYSVAGQDPGKTDWDGPPA